MHIPEVFLCSVLLALAHGSLRSEVPVVPIVPQLDGRIVGGQEVSISEYPYQVSLRYRSCLACSYSHSCGGSIYNSTTVVTAAHCVYRRNAVDYMIVAGTDNRNGGDGVVSRVTKIVIHKDYNASITNNDVAVMFLASELPLNNITVAAIELASEEPETGVISTVTGWGTTSEGGMASNKLLEVEVPIVSNADCNAAYGEGRITESMLCAGTPTGGKDACQGDSGGPLVVNRELAGIVSWGMGCARPDYPGVYANVPHLRDWILHAIETGGVEEGENGEDEVIIDFY